MGRRRSPSFGFSFSWRRAIGLSQAQGKLSRAIGIPLSKSGRQRKLATAWIDLLFSERRRSRRAPAHPAPLRIQIRNWLVALFVLLLAWFACTSKG